MIIGVSDRLFLVICFGLAWHVKPSFVLAGDIEGIWFKDVPAYGNSNAGILPGGTCNPKGSDKSTCMGGKNGAGFGWANDIVFKVGAQWDVTSHTTLRAGFNHGSKVLNNNYATENLITPGALIQNLWTAGLTEKLTKKDKVNCVLIFIPRQYITSNNNFTQSSDLQRVTIHADGWGIGLSWSRAL